MIDCLLTANNKRATTYCSKCVPTFWIEVEFVSVGFCGEGKLGEPGEKPHGARRESTTNSTYIWRREKESNPGYTGGRQGLSSSPLRQPQILLQIQDKIIIINKVTANCGSFTWANLLDLDRVPFLALSVLYKLMQFAYNHVTERDFNSFQSLFDLSLFPYFENYVLI